jgi:hypothetical protein
MAVMNDYGIPEHIYHGEGPKLVRAFAGASDRMLEHPLRRVETDFERTLVRDHERLVAKLTDTTNRVEALDVLTADDHYRRIVDRPRLN